MHIKEKPFVKKYNCTKNKLYLTHKKRKTPKKYTKYKNKVCILLILK